jgi:hypothetical protein
VKTNLKKITSLENCVLEDAETMLNGRLQGIEQFLPSQHWRSGVNMTRKARSSTELLAHAVQHMQYSLRIGQRAMCRVGARITAKCRAQALLMCRVEEIHGGRCCANPGTKAR